MKILAPDDHLGSSQKSAAITNNLTPPESISLSNDSEDETNDPMLRYNGGDNESNNGNSGGDNNEDEFFDVTINDEECDKGLNNSFKLNILLH